MSTTKPPKPKRRWYQFSLMTLLVVMTLFTVTFGVWIQNRRQRAQENQERVAAVQEAVAEIEELGGEVTLMQQKLRPQTWLEEQFDDPGDADDPNEDFRTTSVSFLNAWLVEYDGVTGDRLTELKLNRHLLRLQLDELIEIDNTPRHCDAGFGGLEERIQRVRLYVTDNKVTDTVLEHVTGLEYLQDLDLSYTNVTDAGLEHLKGLSKLKYLRLSYTKVSDAGLEHLKGLTNLESLLLVSTNVTDARLEHLKGRTNLTTLHLENTKVTDAGLEHLKGLTSILTLNLRYTKVTDEGVKKLQLALPNCKIIR